MKSKFSDFQKLPLKLLILGLVFNLSCFSQCPNAGFESGNFTGWTGTNCKADSNSSTAASTQTCILGVCTTIPGLTTVTYAFGVDPFHFLHMSVGAQNQASNATPENSQFIMTSGNDPLASPTFPVVCPGGGTYSARLGNAQSSGGGESMMYKYLVNANNTLFTYNYAVVLTDGGHPNCAQPYFRIRMWVYNSPTDSVSIDCGNYDVDGTTAPKTPGFTQSGSQWSKPWSAVTIPLDPYIGKTVSVQFITRDCCPSCTTDATTPLGCSITQSGGGHFCYAYIDASCAPSSIIPSSPAVCAGQNITLTAPAGAATYSWVGPAGGIVSGQAAQVATVNAPGTYTVNMTTFGIVSCNYFLTVVMPGSLPGGGAVAVNSAVTCVGGSATLTASGGVTYSWAPGGATTAAITVSPGSTTNYTVTGSSSACSSGTATSTVTVNPIPTSPFTVTPVCIGVGSDITYTGNASAADSFNWNFGTGTIISGSGIGPYKVSWSSSGSQNVTLQVTVGTCVSPITTNAVNINPPATINITPSTICAGLKGTLTASIAGEAGGTFLWSDGSSNAAFTSATTLTVTTSYTVTGTNAAGCTGTGVGTITVNQIQDATFSYSPATVCQSGGVNPALSLTGTPGGTFTSSPAGLTLDPNTGAITNIATTTIGAYTVTYTTAGPCPSSKTFVINIVTVPKADFTLGVYCQNVANPLPTFINGGSAGVFSSTAGLVLNSVTGEINLAASTPATYSVKNDINSVGCPPATFTATITINPVPVTTVNSPTICAGATATLTASGGAANYSWSTGFNANPLVINPGVAASYTVTGTTAGCSSSAVGTVTANPIPVVTVNNPVVCAGIAATMTASGATSYLWSTGFNADPLTINPAVAASYTVTGTSLGCSSTALATVTVNPLPVIGVNSPVVCQGLAATLTATGAVSYLWNTGSNANPLVINPAIAANYTVTGTSAAGCTGTAVANVSITLLPVITVNAPAICLGQAATLTATGGATLTWSNGVTARSITVSPNATTTYTVADNTPGCSGSATGTVTVNQPPVIGANSATICLGQPASLLATGAATYVWSNGSVANPLSVSPPTTTTYTVIGTNAAGCKDTTTTTVVVNQPPVVMATSDTICPGINATLTASAVSTGGAVTYLWSNGDVTASTIVNPQTPGIAQYIVTGKDANGCTGTAVGKVTVYKTPIANFDASPNPGIVSSPIITFTDQSSSDVNYWFWSFGDGDTLMPNTKSPVHTYPFVETTYNVTLIVHNAGMCFAQIVHQIVIGPEYSFFIPNAFTPDGDGINDTFFGKGKGIIEYELMIFDRWGNFIFYADDIDKGWDGKANGGADVAQQDVYVWKVALKDVFNKKHNFIGTVTIVRGK